MIERVTVIINTYNRPSSLIKAIDSVQKQKFDNIDLVVVDDCSDTSLKDTVLHADPKINYIRNERNVGLAASRQIGVEASTNDLICFLDDDDIWCDRNKLSKQYQLFEDSNLALVCTDIYGWDGTSTSTTKPIDWPNDLLKHFLKRNGVIYPSTVMLRKSSLLSVGGFDHRFLRGIDSDVYRRMLLDGQKFLFIPDRTVRYTLEATDKITDHVSRKGLYKDLHSNFRTLCKYFMIYAKYPGSFIYRVMKVLTLSCKYLKARGGIRE